MRHSTALCHWDVRPYALIFWVHALKVCMGPEYLVCPQAISDSVPSRGLRIHGFHEDQERNIFSGFLQLRVLASRKLTAFSIGEQCY